MHILVVAATEKEISRFELENLKSEVDFLVTGVGMTATAYSLTKALLKKKYDFVINVGLAGSFREEIKTGEVVLVVTDLFADLGAEDGDSFLSIFDIGLQKADMFPFWNGKLKPEFNFERLKSADALKKVSGITVNTVHGNDESIQQTIQRFHPDIETMEGAAFFYCCMMEKIPCIQLRAVSNRVEKRNKDGWNIPVAEQNLNAALQTLLAELSLQYENNNS
jgi:futalosine hydrolase